MAFFRIFSFFFGFFRPCGGGLWRAIRSVSQEHNAGLACRSDTDALAYRVSSQVLLKREKPRTRYGPRSYTVIPQQFSQFAPRASARGVTRRGQK